MSFENELIIIILFLVNICLYLWGTILPRAITFTSADDVNLVISGKLKLCFINTCSLNTHSNGNINNKLLPDGIYSGYESHPGGR